MLKFNYHPDCQKVKISNSVISVFFLPWSETVSIVHVLFISQFLEVSSLFLISNFCRVLNVVCFLLGNSVASEFYMPTFRNTLFRLHRWVGVKNELGLRMLGYLYGKRFGSSQTFSRISTPTFSNLVILHTYPSMKMEQSVPKRRNIKFRRREIIQKKACNIQHTAKVWNQKFL